MAFEKAIAAVIAFLLGFILTVGLWFFALAIGLMPKLDTGNGLWGGLLGLGITLFLLIGVCAMGGIIAAILSMLFHPTVTLRIAQVITGLFTLAVGIGLLLAGTGLFSRFLLGPLAVGAGAYVVWTAVFGKRSEIESL